MNNLTIETEPRGIRGVESARMSRPHGQRDTRVRASDAPLGFSPFMRNTDHRGVAPALHCLGRGCVPNNSIPTIHRHCCCLEFLEYFTRSNAFAYFFFFFRSHETLNIALVILVSRIIVEKRTMISKRGIEVRNEFSVYPAFMQLCSRFDATYMYIRFLLIFVMELL